MKLVNSNLFNAESIEKMRDEFNNAKPYRHLVIDNFLNAETAELMFNNFPKEDVFNKKYKGVNEFKAEG